MSPFIVSDFCLVPQVLFPFKAKLPVSRSLAQRPAPANSPCTFTCFLKAELGRLAAIKNMIQASSLDTRSRLPYVSLISGSISSTPHVNSSYSQKESYLAINYAVLLTLIQWGISHFSATLTTASKNSTKVIFICLSFSISST